jgi:uncharacterized protein (TIGR02147 family)
MTTKNKRPSICEYYDYRRFLADLFAYHKSISSVFSHRYIVDKAGLKSPNVLKNVMVGKRHLSLATAERFAAAFRLTAEERKFFFLLVRFGIAEALTEKEECLREIARIKETSKVSRLGTEYYDVLEKWWHLAIREIVALPDARNSSKWIARAIQPNITPREAALSIRLLRHLGLIEKHGDGWRPVNATIRSDAAVTSVKAAHFHRQMIQLGAEAITRFPAAKREISGTTLRIAKSEVPKLKELMRNFRLELLAMAEHSENADEVYQLNFQFFPLVKEDRPQRLKAPQDGSND